ncbi:hypothetical protein E4U43_002366 [Claviceps pusilla]|uniref:TAP42-like protein n=1 Tax=Claviceps pusilla TaxID=123648 RepID=A0A9P7SXK2_9HYPO|nr:hypothetical protein E4U43_002366 [Claviceps pusilla]
MASSDEPESLDAAFAEAETKRQTIECLPATSPSYGSDLAALISRYASLVEQVDSLALFSPNESIEDAPTSSLRYLPLHHTIAELVQRTPFSSSSGARGRRPQKQQRILVLRAARDAYERFLSLAEGYALVTGPHAKLLERYRDDEEAFSLVPRQGDMTAKREAKIANFRTEKALREKLALLRRDPHYVHKDEEAVREVYLVDVQWRIHTTFEGLDSLNRELEMLRMAPAEQEEGEEEEEGTYNGHGGASLPSSRNEDTDSTVRLDQPFQRSLLHKGGPLLSKQGRPLQPFTLVGTRTDLAKGVFRPGHNLPTMSVDEYLEEEKRRGGILEGGTDPAPVVLDEDDMEAVDRETYKARRWDDYKDENRRGAGNTLNMG